MFHIFVALLKSQNLQSKMLILRSKIYFLNSGLAAVACISFIWTNFKHNYVL